MQGSLEDDIRRGQPARIVSLSAVIGLVTLLIAISVTLYAGGSAIEIALQAMGLTGLLITLALVRLGRVRVARFFLPSLGWLLANASVLLASQTTPLFFAAINATIILLAAATLGHRGMALFAGLSTAAALILAVAELIGYRILVSYASTGWLTATPIFALLVLFGFHAFRAQSAALEQAGRRAQELETMRQAGAVVAGSLDLQETIERIFEALARVVPYDSAAVMVLHRDELEIVGGRGWEDPASVIGIRFAVPGDNPNTVVLQRREPLIVDNAPEEYAPFREPPHNHIRSWLGVPLIAGDDLVGMISLDSVVPHHYTGEHARLASAFASTVAVALANASHFRAERSRRQMAAMLHDIIQITSSSLELDTVLSQVAQRTAAATEADRCMIFLTDEHHDRWTVAQIQHRDLELEEEEVKTIRRALESGFDHSLFQSIVDERLPVVLSHADENANWIPEWEDRLDIKALVLAPLVTHDQVMGALALDRTETDSPFTVDQIDLAVTVAASVSASIENARLFAQTEKLAITDSLTGILNRRGLFVSAEREVERARRYQRPLSLLLLDLDHFKQLNDAHGHVAGDQVLEALAARLQSSLRRIDILSRYGGEEFVAVLPECTMLSAIGVAERVRNCVEADPFTTQSGDLPVTVSVGVSSTEESSLDLAALIGDADDALYAAKQAGRNQVWTSRAGQPGPAAPRTS